MAQRLKAIYHNGIFVLQIPCDLPEDAEVELTVHDPYTIPPEIADATERATMLKEIVQSMRNNPIPTNAPHLTREDLHVRR